MTGGAILEEKGGPGRPHLGDQVALQGTSLYLSLFIILFLGRAYMPPLADLPLKQAHIISLGLYYVLVGVPVHGLAAPHCHVPAVDYLKLGLITKHLLLSAVLKSSPYTFLQSQTFLLLF